MELKHKQLFQYLENIKGESTAHLSGLKKVFLTNNASKSSLTQFAFGELGPGESCEEHLHPTMEEFFFFIDGSGKYSIDGEVIEIKKNTFITIPANTKHSLHSTGNEKLTFVYFGIAI